MLPRTYLHGLAVHEFGFAPGVYAAPHARRPGSLRILCSYRDGKRHKAELFETLAAAGQREARGEWDLHHVVERQHFADIDFAGRLPEVYADELPCVLIAKPEHRAYNSLLHSSETDELFRDTLPRSLVERSREVAAAARIPGQRAALRARVARHAALYRDTYAGDDVLQRVARNVFDAALRLLGGP